ncbi:GNAT family N-acetyltransferase [Nocardioides sp. URHA0032]|uniref:GNAT family N-acetyltransferase n=1 Tax=Nocardioides sp. URHA0032 TaxID=1380388 RepID=UPI0006870D0A|nr:GNAT family N-acetyltransferase [Nocardioides sp. URHA0032]
MDIHEVAWSDEEGVRRFAAVKEAVRAADAPWEHPVLARQTAGVLRYGWDGEPAGSFLVSVDGVDVATGEYETTSYDNQHLAWLGIDVHPAHRRRGHGDAVLAFLLDRARAEGRTSVGGNTWDAAGPRAFAARHGFAMKSVEVNRRQHLARVDRVELDRLHADALRHARDYELLRRVGATPAAELPALADMTAAINDAPTDDLDIEDEVFPPERVAAYEEAQLSVGKTLLRVYARHRVTGELAGQTVVVVEGERPEVAHQHDTSVVRAHRGHRLGVLLKTEMLHWLAEEQPQVETVDTWNAESNDHMISVNQALGYEIIGRGLAWQRPL